MSNHTDAPRARLYHVGVPVADIASIQAYTGLLIAVHTRVVINQV